MFSLYCLAVGSGKLDRITALIEIEATASQLILELQSGDPACAAVSRPMTGTVENLIRPLLQELEPM